MTSRTVERYLNRGMRSVEGWLDPFSARVIARISQFQRLHGIGGSSGEIGVHHGKLWFILHLTAAPDEHCFAIDLFSEQERNVDGSGRGNLERFEANLRRHSREAGNVHIWQTSSLDVSAIDLVHRIGRTRLFSIDGGHSAECTINDLLIADGASMATGVVVLDDYFNPHWPGVSCGAADYFARADATLRPFAITPNKIFLARPAHHEFYRAELSRLYGSTEFFDKSSSMFGHTVDIYGVALSGGGAWHRLNIVAKRAYWRWHANRSGAR
jgi:hypothetical protein